jgi:hypothetical protein
VLFLILLLGGLVVLYDVSRKTGLHQASFLYRMHINFAQTSATLAPYSIIPTFLAIGAKLWFAMAGDVVQRYQPFIMMVRKPTQLSKCVSAECCGVPTALVSFRALGYPHWLLASVGAAVFFSEARRFNAPLHIMLIY